MTIANETAANIIRYYHIEKWKIGTIARQLDVHHGVVRRVLHQAHIPNVVGATVHTSPLIEPYLPFVQEILKKYPRLTASRLYAMVCQRGYEGGPDHFRHLVSYYRERPTPEAYLRLRTLPGEQGQIDWGHFGHTEIGKARRPVMAFVMVLSYSRKIFLRFYLNAQMTNFLRGHVAAFDAFQGVPRILLYDNLKSAVLERQGDAIRFHPMLLDFSAHYRYEPRPVAVARGNEKGRVERAIRYIRDNFWPARQWKDIDDLNMQATVWCEEWASLRPCPEDKAYSVRQVFEEEKIKLIPLPDNPFSTQEIIEVHIGKTPYARFDLNDYSIPYKYVRRTLTVVATPTHVSIQVGQEVLATHARSYNKSAQIENIAHIEELVARKREAHQHQGQNRLTAAVPIAKKFLVAAAERQYVLSCIMRSLLSLLDRYGAVELEVAMTYALEKGVPHPNTVRLCLERRRDEQELPPPVSLNLSNPRVRDIVIQSPTLAAYDALQTSFNTVDSETLSSISARSTS